MHSPPSRPFPAAFLRRAVSLLLLALHPHLMGTPGVTYILEKSSDLKKWEKLLEETTATGEVTYSHTNTGNPDPIFFRAR